MPFGLTEKRSSTARRFRRLAKASVRGRLAASSRRLAVVSAPREAKRPDKSGDFPEALQKRFTGVQRKRRLPKIIDDESKRGSKSKPVITNEY